MTEQERFNEKWDVQLRKGTLELVILAALKQKERYGLELLKYLHSFETMKITEGTLYPLMDRLKRDGLIDAYWHQEGDSRPRKYYQLTSSGQQKQHVLTERWRRSVVDIERIISQQTNHSEGEQ